MRHPSGYIIVLHEIFHELAAPKKKQNVVILKIDLEKAYDILRWPLYCKAMNERFLTQTNSS